MSVQKMTRNDFTTDKEYEEYQQRMQEMEELEMKHNIQIINRSRLQGKSPCTLFYQFKKGIPLSVFVKVYPYNELVDCGSGFELSELLELETLYDSFTENDREFYIDSFNRLKEIINSIQSNKVPGSYGKGFQSWKEQVAANQEVENILRNPEPSQKEIDDIAYQNYMQTKISSPSQPASLFGKVKNLFGLGGSGRKTSKKILMRQKRSKSQSKKSQSKKTQSKKSQSKNSQSKKSQSKKSKY